MAYVGVDLHRKRSHIVALDPAGEVVLSRRIGNAPTEFLRLFGELEPGPIEVAFGATYGWSWFADLLPPTPASPRTWPTRWRPRRSRPPGSPTAPSTPRPWRTCCGPTCSPEAWIAPPAAREERRLVRTRAGLVRMRSRVQSQLRALLADRGIIPELTTLFGPAGRQWLAELQLPATARRRLDTRRPLRHRRRRWPCSSLTGDAPATRLPARRRGPAWRARLPPHLRHLLEDAGVPARVIDEVMGHETTRRAGQQRGSAIGVHHRHTTAETAARVADAVRSA
jgi:hypothetical protein